MNIFKFFQESILNYVFLSSEIIQRVKAVESPPFRPKVPSNAADRKILDLMRMCWEEIPMFRPNFATIVSVLKQANNGRFVVHLYILIIKNITLLVKKKIV